VPTSSPHKPRTFRYLLPLLATLLNQSTHAQTPPPTSFEVASIHPSGECFGRTSQSPPGARHFTITNANMAYLIGMAYHMGDDQLDNNPSWIHSECYAIEATAPGEGKLSEDQLRLMLQDLLKQRFALAVHRETKEFNGFTLVVAKDGPKLTPTTKSGGPGGGIIDSHGISVTNVSTQSFASILRRPAGAHVVDRTGLTGHYDIKLNCAIEFGNVQADPNLPSVFTALQEQAGLKLVPGKVPVEILYIDHINKTPTDN
jgi:uncharacterized protein (TIGR03435 family)